MKNKGFTLVELLAVIAILAVLILLIVPKVSDVIETNRIKTYKLSINEIYNLISNDYMENGKEQTVVYYYDTDKGIYVLKSDNQTIDRNIDYGGTLKNTTGTITMNGGSSSGSFDVGKYNFSILDGKVE